MNLQDIYKKSVLCTGLSRQPLLIAHGANVLKFEILRINLDVDNISRRCVGTLGISVRWAAWFRTANHIIMGQSGIILDKGTNGNSGCSTSGRRSGAELRF